MSRYRISQYNTEKFKDAPNSAFIIRTMLSLNHQQTLMRLIRLNDAHNRTPKQVHDLVENQLLFMQQAYLYEAVSTVLKQNEKSFGAIEELIRKNPELSGEREKLLSVKDRFPFWQLLGEVRDQISFHYNTNQNSAILNSCFDEHKNSLLDEPDKPENQSIKDTEQGFIWYLLAHTIERRAWNDCVLGKKSGHAKREPIEGITEKAFKEWFIELAKVYLRYSKALIDAWLEEHEIIKPRRMTH
jgi:hypothetical protein